MLRRTKRFVRGFLPGLGRIWKHTFDPARSQTFYPEADRKSKARIFLDQLWWLLRFQEVNFEYYNYGFDRKEGVNPREFIGNIEFRDMRDRLNHRWLRGRDKTSYASVISDKFISGLLMEALGFPTPRILALCDAQSICWREDWQPRPLETLLERDGLDVFCKDILGGMGTGVFPVRIIGGKLWIRQDETTIEQFRKMLTGRYILQERVEQHPRLNEIYPDAINTMRIVTVQTKDGPVPLAAVLRTGVRGSFVDNCTIGGIGGTVDLETGRLGRWFFGKHPTGRADRHPDTGVRFEGIKVPFASEAIQLCTELHGLFPGVHSVGWDIAMTPDGPTVIEANDEWSLLLMQIRHGNLWKPFRALLKRGRPCDRDAVATRSMARKVFARAKRLLVAGVPNVKCIWRMTFDPVESKTFYPEAARKSKARILLDQFWWLLRCQEVNVDYYNYGFDRKEGVKPSQYIGNIEIRNLRDLLNRRWIRGLDKNSYVAMVADKFLFGLFLSSLGFPTPKTLALCDAQSLRWCDGWKRQPLEAILRQNGVDGFFKGILGGHGNEVFPARIEDGKLYVEGNETTVEQLSQRLLGPHILQERIEQHPRLKELYPHAINTMRLVTVLHRGRPEPLPAVLRVGAHGAHVDNWDAGSLVGPIDLQTGRLGKWFITRPGWEGRVQRHPETQVRFEDVEVPFVPEAVELAKALHGFLPGIRSIGWDIGMTPDGPTFVEANDEWGLVLLQASHGNLWKRLRPMFED